MTALSSELKACKKKKLIRIIKRIESENKKMRLYIASQDVEIDRIQAIEVVVKELKRLIV